jgi:enoyl-CoA hydratase/long-chain 3-hydroxyacyl-CoA dehydrogenase
MLESVKSRDELYKISRNGQDIMNQIEQSLKPIVAAIAGSCLGGGLEVSFIFYLLLIFSCCQVALACHYRIALNDKRTGFGVPEVKLGLLPGAGGTQRLLRNLLLCDAIDLLLTGKEIKVKTAKAMGLVDSLVEPIGSDLQDIEYLCSIAVQKAKYIFNYLRNV